MIYSFTIHGNQEDILAGNPIPFQRVIKQKMRASAARYLEWEAYVRACFYDYAAKNKIPIRSIAKQPIELKKGQYCRMDILIGWANGHHGDNDNTWKGIADALFVNDKDIDGSFAGRISPLRRGYVHIRIEILDETPPMSDTFLGNEETSTSRGTGTSSAPESVQGERREGGGPGEAGTTVHRQAKRTTTKGNDRSAGPSG